MHRRLPGRSLARRQYFSIVGSRFLKSDPSSRSRALSLCSGDALLWVVVAVPWLQPFAPGPSSSVVPLLVSWAACAALLLISRLRVPWPVLVALLLLGVAGWAARAQGPVLSAVAALLAGGACAAAVAARRDADEAARWVAAGWLVAGLVSSALALFQYFGVASWFGAWVHPAQAGEAYANLRQRNQFATLTSLALVGLLWLSTTWRPWARLAAVALLAAANAASASRTGLFQWLLIAAVAAAWPGSLRGAWLRLSLAGLAAYLAFSASLPKLLEAASGQVALNVADRLSAPAACSTRATLWPNVLELGMAKPWTGWGWGELDYAHYIHPFAGPRFCDILDNAHNLPLHLAVELGWPVALLMCIGLAWLALGQRPWKEGQGPRRMAWLALGSILLHSLVEYPLWYGPFQMAAGLAVGLLWTGRGIPSPSPGTRFRVHSAWLACLAGAALAYAAWDYHRVSQLYLLPEERAAAYQSDTLAKASRSWLFRDQVRFAELSIMPLTKENAAHMHQLALDMLHFSPEPKVVAMVIDSALLLGRDDVVAVHLARFRAAFPQEHAAWARERGVTPAAP